MEQHRTQTLHLIFNQKSGQGSGASISEIAEKVCKEKNIPLTQYQVQDPRELGQKTEIAIQAALKDGGTLAVAGGDGTIRSVAQKMVGTKVVFAVIPCGTFNFFARAHQIPEDHEEAIRVAVGANKKSVRFGMFNGEVFLINASLGLYAQVIREREQTIRKWGRRQFIAILSTIFSMLKGHRLMRIDLISDGKETKVLTPMIFIGNNALQLRDLNMSVAHCMKMDLLALVTMKPLGLLGMMKLLFHGMTKTLENVESLESFCVDSLAIHTRRKVQTVALDGELFKMSSPFEVKAIPDAVMLMVK